MSNNFTKLSVLCFVGLGAIVYAQSGRVGINTTTPDATMQIAKKTGVPDTQAQGVTFPNFTTAEREKFTNVSVGNIIFNTDKKCLEMYMGQVNSVDTWTCVNNSENGTATVSNKIEYIISLAHRGTSIQGKINNGANKLVIKIPYTNGSGTYSATESAPVNTAMGHNGDRNKLSLKIDAGTFSSTGTLTATVNVTGSDNEYLVRQLAPEQTLDIATIPVRLGQSTFTVVLKATGAVVDKCFGQTTKQCVGYGADVKEHDFVYVPITGPDGKTWLSHNLGAEYTRIGSPHFNPFTQAGGDSTDPSVIKNDWKAYGSLFQWQRKPDGHELVNWTNATTGRPKYGTVNRKGNNWTINVNNYIHNDDTNTSIPSDNWSINNTAFNLWQPNGANNPCPVGYHVPTKAELDDLKVAIAGYNANNSEFWNNDTVMRLSASGSRHYYFNGSLRDVSSNGYIWGSDTFDNDGDVNLATSLSFKSNNNRVSNSLAVANGFAVRCIKN